jgi:diguanylate cyclase (GGDEF)-like protein
MVLQAVARILRDTVRTIDVVGRYGGEEFCVLCPRTTMEEAAAIAKRVVERVCTLPLPAPLPGHVSVSIGVATVNTTGDARRVWDTLFEAADRALYVSKRAGRNGVVRADTLLMQPHTTLASAAGER